MTRLEAEIATHLEAMEQAADREAALAAELASLQQERDSRGRQAFELEAVLVRERDERIELQSKLQILERESADAGARAEAQARRAVARSPGSRRTSAEAARAGGRARVPGGDAGASQPRRSGATPSGRENRPAGRGDGQRSQHHASPTSPRTRAGCSASCPTAPPAAPAPSRRCRRRTAPVSWSNTCCG